MHGAIYSSLVLVLDHHVVIEVAVDGFGDEGPELLGLDHAVDFIVVDVVLAPELCHLHLIVGDDVLHQGLHYLFKVHLSGTIICYSEVITNLAHVHSLLDDHVQAEELMELGDAISGGAGLGGCINEPDATIRIRG